LEEDLYSAAINILVIFRIMYQQRYLLWSDFLGTIPKDKKHSINNIRLSRSIWPNNRRKTLQNITKRYELKYSIGVKTSGIMFLLIWHSKYSAMFEGMCFY